LVGAELISFSTSSSVTGENSDSSGVVLNGTTNLLVYDYQKAETFLYCRYSDTIFWEIKVLGLQVKSGCSLMHI